MSSEADTVHTDIAGLSELLSLPAVPERVQWHRSVQGAATQGALPGPSSSGLEAVLTFSADDVRALEQQAKPFVVDRAVEWDASYFEPWYPASIRDSFVLDPASGKYRLERPLYDATTLFGKPPYSAGHFIITNSGDVFVSMGAD